MIIYMTYFQNYIVSKKINVNSRQINDEIFNQTINGFSLEEIILKNEKYLPKHFYNDPIEKIKIFY